MEREHKEIETQTVCEEADKQSQTSVKRDRNTFTADERHSVIYIHTDVIDNSFQ